MTGLSVEANSKLHDEVDCSGRPFGCYGISECGSEYFCCRGQADPTIHRCPNSLTWEQKSRSCRWRSLTEECQKRFKKNKRSSAPFIQKGERIVAKSNAYICRGKSNGRYANPESSCSSFFIICDDDVEYLVSCTNGRLFSSASEGCLPADEIKQCAEPSRVFAKYRGEVTPAKLIFSCGGQADGNYEDPSNPCSRRFFSCSKGNAALRFCPKQARFDKDIDKCNLPEYTRSCGGSTTITSLWTGVTGKNKVERKIEEQAKTAAASAGQKVFKCNDKDDGQYPDPERACSSRYFTCLSGFTFPRQCPPSLFFDPVMMACTFRQYIAACGGRSTTTTEATKESSFTEISAPDLNCDDLPLGVYAHPKDSCSQVFYTCVGASKAVKMFCPNGTFFDERKSSCNYPSEMPECSKKSNKTVTQIENRASKHVHDMNRTFGYLEKPCSKFYYEITKSNRLRKRNCNGSLFFDLKTRQCLSKSNVTSCLNDKTSSMDLANRHPFDCKYLQNGNYLPPGIACPNFYYQCEDKNTVLTACPDEWTYHKESDACKAKQDVPGCTHSKMTHCERKGNGFYQDLRYCSKFHLCLDGEDLNFDCEDGKVFEWRSKACLTVSKASSPCGTRRDKFNCKGKRKGYYAHAQDCTKYYFCKNGRMSLLECEEGRAYHPRKMQCLPLREVPGCVIQKSASAVANKSGLCGEGSPNALMANPDYPSEAILCINQNAYFLKCGNDAKPYFDPQKLTCVSKNKKHSNDTKLTPLSIERKLQEPLFDCSKKMNGSYAPNENDCSSYFYECVNERPFLVRCPEDMMFSIKESQCVELTPQSDCWKQVLNTPCHNRASGFYPHSKDCSKYIICIDGHELILNCPGELVYDPQSRTCLPTVQVDLPCGDSDITPPFFCDEEDDSVFEDNTDPTHFYRCTGGRPIRFTCQEGHKFNAEELRCEIDDKLALMSPVDKCNLEKNGLYADVRSCESMIFCTNGIPFLIRCNDEEKPVLNPETITCVPSFPGCEAQ
uniref:Chitin-binding type-2 domain-containing protein n=1 Tax=Trichuris muris TaxID=70415 RepID=A0A5S6QFN6_TRIMR